MTSRNKNIPALRFKGFIEPWSKGKLNTLTSYVDYRGRGPEKSEHGIFLVTAKNIKKGFIDYECSKEYVPLENYSEVMSKGIPKTGDILFTTEAPLGNVAQVDNSKIALAQRVIKLRTNGSLYNSYLLYYMLSEVYQKLILTKAIGSTVLGISGKELQQTDVSFPSLPEQQKIASFLSAIDEKIRQLTCRKELLEQYKKGLMQQLFSGKLRFKPAPYEVPGDEKGKAYPKWEEKQFKDLVLDFRLGGNYPNTEEITQYPLIKMGNLGRGIINLNKLEYIPKDFEIDSRDKIEYGDLFFNTRNTLDLVGKVAIWRNELAVAYYNSNLMFMKFENNFFMNYRLNSYEGVKSLKRFATGTTSVAAIYTKDLLNLKLTIPSLDEQQKIASFLSSIDSKIENVSAQIERTQRYKKGLLQKMFV